MQVTLGTRLRFLGIEAIDHAIFDPTGVSQNVAVVETNDIAEIIDASFVTVDRIRLNRMLQNVAEELSIEDLGNRGGPHFHRREQYIAVDGLRDGDADGASISIGRYQTLSVESLSCSDFRTKGPSAQERWQGNGGVRIQAPNNRGSLEAWLVTRGAFRSEFVGVHELRIEDRDLHPGHLQARDVSDVNDVALHRALVVLVTGREEAKVVSRPTLTYESRRTDLGVDGIGKTLAEPQTKKVGAEVVDGDDAAEV